jgi:RNA polymerase sigma factor (sigma-70 family)
MSMLREALRLLRRQVLTEDEPVTDAQLLSRYSHRHDESAFTELVRRHGTMVLGVCRRLLGSEHAAEDAFQATFLVLVRRAGALRWHESIAGWLHEVARRTARKVRSRPISLPLLENAMPELPPANDTDLREVLDDALASLPEHYRTPLVLCCCEGQTNEEAAQALGCALGTVKSRLARGRDLLRQPAHGKEPAGART